MGLAVKGTDQIWANQTGGVFAALAGANGGAICLGMIFLLFAAQIAVSAGGLVIAAIIAGLFTWAGAATSGASLSSEATLAAGVSLVPAGIFVLGTGTLVHGLAPPFAVAAGYLVVAWSFLIEVGGASLGLSHWLLDTSIFHHMARAPAAPVQWDMAAILTAVGIAAAIIGALAFSRRDLQGA